MAARSGKHVERVQTGVRIEKRILKVLKSLAYHKEISLSDLLEGMILHSLENRPAFNEETLQFIRTMREVYHLDLGADDAHTMEE